MNYRIHLYNLVAFLAVLAAILLITLLGKDVDIAILTGLVGVLGSFRPWGLTAPDQAEVPKDAKQAAAQTADAAVEEAERIEKAGDL